MNKPAPKEPSMDEILSSIRQIIADDDVGARKAAPVEPAQPAPAPTAPRAVTPAASPMQPEAPAPLALSAAQIVTDEPDGEDAPPQAPMPLSFESILAGDDEDAEEPEADPYAEAELVEPDDIAFEAAAEPEPEPYFPPPPPPPRPATPVARAAPMPDPSLSAEIAEQLLEPTTKAAVRHTFAKLSNLSVSAPGLTLEEMMRDMLRPMLKEWLDENLPAVVERIVEKEIERISRGPSA